MSGKYRWGCGRCGREFTNNDYRETTCPGCGGYLFNPDGKTPITDGGVETHDIDRLVYGGICPVCKEEFDDGFDDLEDEKSYEGVRICIVDKGAEEGEALIHVPDDAESEP